MSGTKFVSVRGPCSFCRKDLRLAPTVVGVRDSGAAICDFCVGLCCDILTEEAEAVEPTPHYGEELSFDDDRFRVHFAAVMRTAATQRERRLAKRAGPASSSDAPQCSFCHRPRDAVAKLINGPRIYICEACVAAAAQAIGDDLASARTAI